MPELTQKKLSDFTKDQKKREAHTKSMIPILKKKPEELDPIFLPASKRVTKSSVA